MKKKYLNSEPDWYYFPGSSRVHKACYDEKNSTLTIEFTDGVRWNYFFVSSQEWADFITSGSPGKFVYDILDHKQNGASSKK